MFRIIATEKECSICGQNELNVVVEVPGAAFRLCRSCRHDLGSAFTSLDVHRSGGYVSMVSYNTRRNE